MIHHKEQTIGRYGAWVWNLTFLYITLTILLHPFLTADHVLRQIFPTTMAPFFIKAAAVIMTTVLGLIFMRIGYIFCTATNITSDHVYQRTFTYPS